MATPDQPKGIVVARGDAAFDRVAGLTLALRALLELSRAGVDDLTLVVDEGVDASAVVTDPRVGPVEISTESVSTLVDRPAVVIFAEAAAARSVYGDLVAAAKRGRAVRTADDGPHVALPSADGAEPETIDVEWVERDRRRIIDNLFEACRKPVDGIVSRHLNRHVSIFVSKRIVNWSVSPNTITLLTLVLAVASALTTARATYGWMLIGAALLQLNSILDGVDGELARVRFQHSKLGQWLDTVCDDVANTGFYAALTYASFQIPSVPEWVAWSGVAGVVLSMVTMATYYAELIRLGSGDFYALDVGQEQERTGLWHRINRGARYVTKRDFFVFAFFVAALIGILPYVLPVVAAGTVATAVTGIRITFRRWAR